MFLILLFACYQALFPLFFICYSSVIDQAKKPSNPYTTTDLEITDQKSSVFHLLSDNPLGVPRLTVLAEIPSHYTHLYCCRTSLFWFYTYCFFVFPKSEKNARIVSRHRNPLWIKELEAGSFLAVLAVTLNGRMDRSPGQPFHSGRSARNTFHLHCVPSNQTLWSLCIPQSAS